MPHWHQTIHHHTIEFSKNTHPPATHPKSGLSPADFAFNLASHPVSGATLPAYQTPPAARNPEEFRTTERPSNPKHSTRATTTQAKTFRGGQPRNPVSTPHHQTLPGLPGRRRGSLTRHKLRTAVPVVKSPGQSVYNARCDDLGVQISQTVRSASRPRRCHGDRPEWMIRPPMRPHPGLPGWVPEASGLSRLRQDRT